MIEKTVIERCREIARAAGEMYFDTGEPCQNGHYSKRYTSIGRCCQCDLNSRTKYRNTEAGKKALAKSNKKYHNKKKHDPEYCANKLRIATDYYNARKHDPDFLEDRNRRSKETNRKKAALRNAK